jgi:DNA polymerase-3 subunit delta'
LSWDQIRGHDTLVRAFEHVVRRGRLAHAYLFVGPSGIGKRLFAQELARALLCESPPADSLRACDQCTGCALTEAGNHPDLFVGGRAEGGNELAIDVVRELCQSFALKSARGRGKVAILDDADDLNEEAANCFLKTLEEPPARSVLLLIGTSPDRQLPTIRSRCQVVPFSPLSPALLEDWLRSRDEFEPAEFARLVRLSGGSPGRALAVADKGLWEFRAALLNDLVRGRRDSVAQARDWQRFVEEAGKEAPVQRRRAASVLRLLIAFLQDALCLSLGGTPAETGPEELPLLQEIVRRADSEKLLECLQRCLDADEQIDRWVQLVLVLEGLLDALGQKFAL